MTDGYTVTTTSGNSYNFDVEQIKENCYKISVKESNEKVLSYAYVNYETVSIYNEHNRLLDVYNLPLTLEDNNTHFIEGVKNIAENAIISVYNARILEKKEKIEKIIEPYVKKDA